MTIITNRCSWKVIMNFFTSSQRLQNIVYRSYKKEIFSTIRRFISNHETNKFTRVSIDNIWSLTYSLRVHYNSIWIDVVVWNKFLSSIKIYSIWFNLRWKRYFSRQILRNRTIDKQKKIYTWKKKKKISFDEKNTNQKKMFDVIFRN